MFKKIIALLMAVLMLCGVLVSCKKDDETDADAEETTVSTDGDAEETLNDADTLIRRDFGGAIYRILSRTSTLYEYESEDGLGGSAVDQQVYYRNEEVQDEFNVKIKVDDEKGDWGSGSDVFIAKVENAVKAGTTSTYSLISTHSSYLANLAVSGYAYNMNNLNFEYEGQKNGIDLTKEWWSDELVEDCSIDGKIYFMVGDIAYTLYEYMEVVFFNPALLEGYNVYTDDIYDLVREGGWTFEKMMALAKDLDYGSKLEDKTITHSNGFYQDVYERFGLMLTSHGVQAMYSSIEDNFIYKDESTGRYKANTKLPEAFVTYVDELLVKNIVENNGIYWNQPAGKADLEKGNELFKNGQGMFYIQQLSAAEDISTKITDFGILPLPKYNATQEEYYTGVRDTMSGVFVLSNCEKLEMVATITEAMCMKSYQKVRPAFYEITMKGRYSSNTDVQEMLDMIRNNLKLGFGLMYNNLIGNPYYNVQTCYLNTSKGQSTKIETLYNAKALQEKLDAMYLKVDQHINQ